MVLQYFLIMFFHDSIYFVKCTDPTLQRKTHIAWYCHPCASPFGCFQACNLNLFPPNVTMVSMTTHTTCPEIDTFISQCIGKQSSDFYVPFGVVTSSFLSSVLAHVSRDLVSPWKITLFYYFQPASSHGLLLLFWDWLTYFAPKQIHLWDTQPVSFPVCSNGWKHACGGPQFCLWKFGHCVFDIMP